MPREVPALAQAHAGSNPHLAAARSVVQKVSRVTLSRFTICSGVSRRLSSSKKSAEWRLFAAP